MYLDYLTNGRDYFAIDIEADSLYPSKIWCMCYENIRTKEKGVCVGHDTIRSFLLENSHSVFIGHNILKYDAPSLNRLVGSKLGLSRLVDTLILATLYNPSLDGGHSLGEWGERIGMSKGEFNDWSKLSPEMIEYCHRDVSVTAALFRRLVAVLNKIGFSERSCYIQHHITHILEKQQKNGFEFDAERAITFYQMLRRKESEINDEVRAVFPAERRHVATRAKFKKDGSETEIYKKDKARYIIQDGNEEGTYLAFEDVHFNLGSPQQRTQRLLELGWQNYPDEVTKTGNPKPFDKGDLVPSLQAFLEETPIPEVELIAKWMSINGRANMVNNWLDNWNEDTGRIHGKLFVADTLRFKHNSPNTANIPAVRVNKLGESLRGDEGYWTYEARDLWVARSGRVLVGTDAAGLELRMLAHYLNRAEFTNAVINGKSEDGTDVHSFNANLAGVTRTIAKTLIYATMYGAQAKKVASIIKGSFREGKELREVFLERLGIKELMDDAIYEQKTGRVWLVDGAGVVCPSPHSALNYKLQGSGARVMSLASIILEQQIRKKGLDSLLVGSIHDEWQYDVAPEDAEEHGRLAVDAIRMAGEELNLNIPLGGSSKAGKTWSQTH